MDRTLNCIKMLELLAVAKAPLKRDELAGILDTNVRNIIEYKLELECAGYNIESVTGKDGGYVLKSEKLVPSRPLSTEEIQSLKEGAQFLKEKGFLNINDFNSAMVKFKTRDEDEDIKIRHYPKYPLSMSEEELQERVSSLKKAIKFKKKVFIVDEHDEVQIIHPLKIIVIADDWKLFARVENEDNKEKIEIYKINILKEIRLLPQVFEMKKHFNESDYFDGFGIKNHDKWLKIKILLKDQACIAVNERIYGKDQEIQRVDENSCILSVTIKEKDAISFVLGWGVDCKVIEPQSLIENIKEMTTKILEKY